jgi:hypothetical protein
LPTKEKKEPRPITSFSDERDETDVSPDLIIEP